MKHLAMCLGISSNKLVQEKDCVVKHSNNKYIVIPTIFIEEEDLEVLREKAKDAIDRLINPCINDPKTKEIL